MRLTIKNDILQVERPHQPTVAIQTVTAEDRYKALLAYNVPEHIARAVTHGLITIALDAAKGTRP